MRATAEIASNDALVPFRVRYRAEMACQIVHDSIHSRPGWTRSYLLAASGESAGFGTLAIAGPWQERPTLLEFYVVPEWRTAVFELFEALLAATGAQQMEIQSNDALPLVMLHTYAQQIVSEKIVFRDSLTTALTAPGATLRPTMPTATARAHQEARQGGPEWVLEVNGSAAGKGGVLFHYNRPYGDIYMEVDAPFRRQGLGAYLVQQLKLAAYQMGAIPCARCSPDNVASRSTLQRAGFVPYAHILTGAIGNR
jgi:GNAT superfamily N-acetyltransferase